MNDMEEARIPPHSEEAESSVLGAALQSKEALSDVMEVLGEEDFYRPQHALIFQAMSELYMQDKEVDYITVLDILRKKNKETVVGGLEYLATLTTVVPSPSSASQYANIMLEKAMLRRLISTSTEILSDSYADQLAAIDILDKAEQDIFDIAKKRQTREYIEVGKVVAENVQNIQAIKDKKGKFTGLPTGFADLDKKTSGLQKSDMIVLAARPSIGKTSFALNVALNVARGSSEAEPATVLIFSLEMSASQIGQRLLATEARVNLTDIRDGAAYEKKSVWEKIQKAEQHIQDFNIFIDDTPGISIADMRNKCRRLSKNNGSIDLIIIDYLQLMELPNFKSKQENRQQEISTISRMIKQLARDMDCPVLILSQLSRAVEQRGKHATPILSDLRDSGAIEQDADIVMFIAKENETDTEDSDDNVRRILIEKHRNGPTGVVSLSWIGAQTRFGNLAYNEERLPKPDF
jgi:replicative DNA helicase